MNPESPETLTPQRILQMAWGYAAPLVIETAIELRFFDILNGAPRTAEEVAMASGASLRGTRSVLNALIGFELLAKEGARYTLTPESAAFLVHGKPGYHGGFFAHISTQLLPKWMQLTDVVHTGQPATAVNDQAQGAAFFEKFVESLFPISYHAAQAVSRELRLSETPEGAEVSVLDLAAGSGVWGIGLAEASPGVRVTAVDWPEVLKVTESVAKRHGAAERFSFISGDLLQADFGGPHHIATLGHILHSEGPERSLALLHKTAGALAPGGTIVISEFVPNDERTGPAHVLIFAVNMLVNTTDGDAFTFGEISAWLQEAGFENVRRLEAPAPSPLILANKR